MNKNIFQLCCELKSKEVSQSFKTQITKKDNIHTHGGMSQASADGEKIELEDKLFALILRPDRKQMLAHLTHTMSLKCKYLGTTHSVRHEEQLAFSDWINTNLGHDEHLHHILPLNDTGLGLYDAVKDGITQYDHIFATISRLQTDIFAGILLCKIVNHSCPDTVDERVINMKPNSVYKRCASLQTFCHNPKLNFLLALLHLHKSLNFAQFC